MILRFVLFLAHLLAELPRYPQGPFSGTPDTGGGPANSVTGPDNYGDSPKVGTSGRFARGDHDHGLPAAAPVTFAAPTVALGTVAAAGAAATTIRSDSTIVAFDATVPVTQAFSDAAATGAAAVAARRDHKHGMPATPAASFAGARARISGAVVIPDSAWTAVALATEDYDTAAFHDPAVNNSRMTAAATGYFDCHALLSFNAAATGNQRYSQLYKNGVAYSGAAGGIANAATNGVPGLPITDIIPVVATDYIELFAYQDSGGNLNLASGRLAVQFVPA